MFLALDQGTTSSRAFVFAADGSVRGSGQCEFTQHFPGPGLVEHDPEEILHSQSAAIATALRAAGAPALTAVGIANQRETVVVFERATGRAIHPAIVWQDRRTAGVLEALRRTGAAERVRAATGLSLDPYFSAAKIAWILDHVPGARARAERGELCAGTIDTWLLHRLGDGRCVTDASNASRTSLFDLRRGDFDDALCELFRVPRACLPEVADSAAEFGPLRGHGAPIRAVLGDQQAALFAHDCRRPGSAKCTYGTGAFLLQNAGDRLPEPRPGVLATVAWRLGGAITFAYEGSVLVCGAAIQWLRDELQVLARSGDAEALARSVPDSGGVVFVPALAGLGTPHWEPRARGLLAGLHRGTQKAHLVRAAIEAMALQVDDVLAAFGGLPPGEPLRVDGGASSNRLLLELQAALRGGPVVRPGLLEATAFGVFRLACHQGGVPLDALPQLPGPATVVAPDGGPDAAALAALRERWRRAVAAVRSLC